MLGLGPKAAGRKLCPSMLDRSTAYSLVASRTFRTVLLVLIKAHAPVHLPVEAVFGPGLP